jgi:threonine dehydratase
VAVVTPHGVPEMKCEAIRAFGADLRYAGTSLAEAAREARRVAAEEGRICVR